MEIFSDYLDHKTEKTAYRAPATNVKDIWKTTPSQSQRFTSYRQQNQTNNLSLEKNCLQYNIVIELFKKSIKKWLEENTYCALVFFCICKVWVDELLHGTS